jgi:hypothetical protein
VASPLTRQDVVDLLVTERFAPAPLPDLPRPPAARPAAPVRKPDEPAVTESRRRRLCESIDGRYLVPIDVPKTRKAA